MILTEADILSIESIEKEACRYFHVCMDEVYDKNSKRTASAARAFIFYIIHVDLGISVGKISLRYGRRRNTIFKSISKIKYRVEMQKSYREIYRSICGKI